MTPDRRTALAVTVVGTATFVVLAAVLVPWSPVPGGMPAPVRASTYFTSDQVAAAEDFARSARSWAWSSLGVSLAVASVLGFTRLGGRLVERLPGPWWSKAVLAVVVLGLVGRLVTLPFGLASWRDRVEAGLSTQSLGGYLRDALMSELVGVVAASAVVLVLLGCARRWARAWPAVAGAFLGALVMAGSFVYPVAVEPLFNSFSPLPAGPLRTEILRLAEEEDVPVDEVLVADASRRTTTLNAYVSGLGGTRRVVVYDNLVEDLPQDQALSVVAHELAHARHDDVLTGSLLGATGVVGAVGLLGLLVGRRRAPGLADARVVPWLLAVTAIATLVASPVQNTISRRIELRADVDALRVTGDPDAFVAMHRQLTLRSLNDPTPPAWSQVWFGSHPTVLQRIALADTPPK